MGTINKNQICVVKKLLTSMKMIIQFPVVFVLECLKMQELQVDKEKDMAVEQKNSVATETPSEDKVADRRKDLQQLLKQTAEQCSANTKASEKASVRQKLQEEKEKPVTKSVKKSKVKEAAVCV